MWFRWNFCGVIYFSTMFLPKSTKGQCNNRSKEGDIFATDGPRGQLHHSWQWWLGWVGTGATVSLLGLGPPMQSVVTDVLSRERRLDEYSHSRGNFKCSSRSPSDLGNICIHVCFFYITLCLLTKPIPHPISICLPPWHFSLFSLLLQAVVWYLAFLRQSGRDVDIIID